MTMRSLLAVLVLASMALPAVATAAAPPPDRGASQFYIFDPQAFEGSVRGPGIDVIGGRHDVRFQRLLELKKELVPGIYASRRDSVFK